jgi:hypothetical protein
VVAAGSPPVVAIGVWLNFVKSHLAIDFAKSHPVIAIILFGTYEIMLVVVFFFLGDFEKIMGTLAGLDCRPH